MVIQKRLVTPKLVNCRYLVKSKAMYLKNHLQNFVNHYYSNRYICTNRTPNQEKYCTLLYLLSLTFALLGTTSVVLVVIMVNLKTASNTLQLKLMTGKTSQSLLKIGNLKPTQQEYTSVNHTHDFSTYTSPYDAREYQFTTLPNGLRVLAVENPQSYKSGASITISVGSFNDPNDYPGLAHLCEHMTFYGGTKNTSESMEFARYVTSHDGDYNAFTSQEQTTFTFTIPSNFFELALSLFAEMFAHPGFDPMCVHKEMLAVEQEHQMNICNDEWIVWQLLKRVTNSKSIFHKMQHGNMDSLNRSGILKELKKFYTKHYVANQVSWILVIMHYLN